METNHNNINDIKNCNNFSSIGNNIENNKNCHSNQNYQNNINNHSDQNTHNLNLNVLKYGQELYLYTSCEHYLFARGYIIIHI